LRSLPLVPSLSIPAQGGTPFLVGRVALDVQRQCIRPRLVKPDSTLNFFRGAALIDLFVPGPEGQAPDGAAEPLLRGIFANRSALDSGTWVKLGALPIEVERIDFPMGLTLRGPRPHLEWGELMLPVPISVARYNQIEARPTIHGSALVSKVAGEVLAGRTASLQVDDLRFSPDRDELMRLAKLDPGSGYNANALERGYDLKRFFAPEPSTPDAGPLIVCPYCWSEIGVAARSCPACGQDTSRDAKIEIRRTEWMSLPKRACKKCGDQIPARASICSKCRTKQ
jgi:double zinc ribbon protein